jgi:DNA-binding CsgD family transcriptional regulator
MDQDPSDPGFEAIGVSELRYPAPGQHEGVLQRVLGETRVAQDSLSHRIEAVADLVHQDCERLAIALASPLDQVSIHPETSGHHGKRPRTTHYDGEAPGQRSCRKAPGLLLAFVALVSPASGPVAAARDTDVLRLVAAGLSNRRIAERLFIAESAAGVHVWNAIAKPGVGSRAG